MKTATGPEFLESVANHPDVYRAVSCKGCGPIRLGDHWAECIGIEFGDHGGFIYHRQAPGVYEVHTLFLPHTKDAAQFARQSLAYMFGEQSADLILTQIAVDLPHVRRFALKQGFTKFHEIHNGWERDSGPVDVEFFELSREAFKCLQQQSSA